MNQKNEQYSLAKILGISLAGALPMWVLGWLIYPPLSQGMETARAGLLRIQLLSIGLIWQFVLSMIILYQEEGNIRWETIARRFWLQQPVSPKTGKVNKRLWWWLIPFALFAVAVEMFFGEALTDLWLRIFPFFAAPAGFTPDGLFAPDLVPQWVGSWELLLSFLVLAVFNTFLGEEFLYRGVLLPKMNGVFGSWDWVANGVIFTLYHMHQPWSLLAILPTNLGLAFSGKFFRSNWFPIILHSGQSVIFLVLILGVVLGLA